MSNNFAMLDIVDASNGFMMPHGNLYIPDSDKLIQPTKEFFDAIRPGMFELALVKNDTHFEGEYKHSEEAKIFPFHQGWKTFDHDYAVEVAILAKKTAVYWMFKNKFDMWADDASVGVPANQIEFKNAEEEYMYEKLFHIARRNDDGSYRFLMHRDIFMSYLTLKRVAIIGVAEDYCVRDAIIGYLKRGFEVTMLDDLTHGIYNPAQDPTGVNDWDELVEKHFADAVKSGQLLTEKSGNYLAKLTAW